MKNIKLTYKELVNYLDLYNDDPMVRQLLAYIDEKEEMIIEGLVDAGMDPDDCRFESDHGGWHLPGPYIQELRSDADFYQREMQEWQEKYDDMKSERDRLKARSVADLLADMQEKIRRAEGQAQDADRIATQLKARNRDLEEKINVWTIMEK